ncbi:MAG: response regulator [Thermodesulfobacteriota bacterium]
MIDFRENFALSTRNVEINMEDTPIKVLLIEDDTKYADLVKIILARGKSIRFNLEWCDSLSKGIQRLAKGGIELVLLDLQLPDCGGLETFVRTYKQVSNLPIIVLTGTVDETLAVKSVHMGAQDYLIKADINNDYLIRSIRYAIERKRAQQSLKKAHDELEKRVEERTAELRRTNELLKREIVERKRAEESLAAEKEQLAVTLRSIGDGVITADTQGKIALINRVAEDLTGWSQEEAIGRPLSEVFHIVNEKTGELLENPVNKVLDSGLIVGLANLTVLIAKGGTERIIADSGAPITDGNGNIIGVVLVFRDITEQRNMEEELLKAQQLESLGVLAGGLAHDFKNLLTAILGNISIIKTYGNPDDKTFKRLTEAEKACIRANELTGQLLTFSKGGLPVKTLVSSLGELIKNTVAFAMTGSNVRCEFYLEEGLWPVEVDEGQISQVMNNIVINAQQAMPEGGLIKIKAENVTSYEPVAGSTDYARYVSIIVEDHGIGIPKDYLTKIFDPYFTTKQMGSGLGLTIVYSIIKNHDGYIEVESELEKGTKFCVYIPASYKAAAVSKAISEGFVEGSGRILVMDDEEGVREALGEILRRLGYEVDFAVDGAEAIEKYTIARNSGRSFVLVIMDLKVPGGLGGKEAISRLLEIDPEVKAIVSSGYSNDPVMSEYRRYGFRGVITKPYKTEELSEAVHEAMMESPLKNG